MRATENMFDNKSKETNPGINHHKQTHPQFESLIRPCTNSISTLFHTEPVVDDHKQENSQMNYSDDVLLSWLLNDVISFVLS